MVTADKLTEDQVEAYARIEALTNTRQALDEDIAERGTRLKFLKSQVSSFETRLKIAQTECERGIAKYDAQRQEFETKAREAIQALEKRRATLETHEKSVQQYIQNAEVLKKKAMLEIERQKAAQIATLDREISKKTWSLNAINQRLDEIKQFVG